jgi:hypothetical protein
VGPPGSPQLLPQSLATAYHIYGMPHARAMASAETSVRVSRQTLGELERFQAALGARTLDEAISSLLALKRKQLIAQIYGSARGIGRFREPDRIDTDH